MLLAKRREPRLRHRCRARPVASLAARSPQDRVDGRNRYPQVRGQAAARAARYRRHRRQLHFAEGGAAGGAVAGSRADASAGADQAAIRGGAESTPSTASSATRWCIRKSATTSRRSPPRSAAPISRCFRRRSPAATAISNSSWARAVADSERLVIDHVGHHGDGVAIAGGGNIYVPYTLGGETVEVGAGSRPPSRPPAIAQGRGRKPGADRAVLSAFRRLRRLRDPALGRRSLSRLEARARGDDAGAGGNRLRRRAAGRCPWRGPPAHHPARADGNARRAQGRLCGGRFARHHPDRPLPDPRPGSERRDRGGLGHRRAADFDRQAARHPDHRDQ